MRSFSVLVALCAVTLVSATEEARHRLPHHKWGMHAHHGRSQHKTALTEHRAQRPLVVAKLGRVQAAGKHLDPAEAPVALASAATPASKQPAGAETVAAAPVAPAATVATAVLVKPTSPAAPKASIAAAAKAAEPVDEEATVAATPPAQAAPEPSAGEPSAAAELHQDLAALQQRRTNTVMLKQALQANAALLRQTASLARASRGQARVAAENQLKRGEQMVLSMAAMVKEGQTDALEAAREAAEEAAVMQRAADELSAEATAQLKLFAGAGHAEPNLAAQKPARAAKQHEKDEEEDED